MNGNVLEIKNLKKHYGANVGIEDVSLSLTRGGIYGFIGPNGAGKSTTIRTVMGLLRKSGGEILLDGEPLDMNDPVTKRRFGYLPSEINLWPDMTVGEIFDFHGSFYKDDVRPKREELTALLKIDETKKAGDLSLGNSKKVGIVLALMHSPEVIILDEPTSGLDPIMQGVFHDILISEREEGAAVLYSSHVLSEISNVCDRVGFIKDGVIIKEDLMSNIRSQSRTYLTVVSRDIEKIKEELGLKIKEQRGDEVKFINDRPVKETLLKLVRHDPEKVLIEEIPLEDMFADYYR